MAWLGGGAAAAAGALLFGSLQASWISLVPLLTFTIASGTLRMCRTPATMRWRGSTARDGALAACLAALVGALPEAWGRLPTAAAALLRPLTGALTWLFPLVALYCLAEPRKFGILPCNRWGWPTQPHELLTLAILTVVAAATIGGFSAEGGWLLITPHSSCLPPRCSATS